MAGISPAASFVKSFRSCSFVAAALTLLSSVRVAALRRLCPVSLQKKHVCSDSFATFEGIHRLVRVLTGLGASEPSTELSSSFLF